jgi:hypothetical protein
MLKKLFTLCLLLVFVLPAAAQDEQAIVDEIVALVEVAQDYASYSFHSSGETYTSVEYYDTTGEMLVDIFNYDSYDYTGEASFGDDPSGAADFTSNIAQWFNDEGGEYRAFGEIRFVNGDYYLSGETVSDDELQGAGLPELDGTWILAIDTILLESLNLMTFYYIFNESESPTLDVILPIIVNENTIIESGEAELDGDLYDSILFVFDAESTIQFFEALGSSAQEDPISAFLFDAMRRDEDDTLTFEIQFLINSDGLLAGVYLYLDFFAHADLAEIDAPALGPEGEFVIGVTIRQDEIRTNINGPVSPVEAPEV